MPSFWEKARLDLSHEEMIELFSSAPFEFEPGDRYQYNNSAYYLLGVIIARVSGDRYAEFLQSKLFRPLGLMETHYLDNHPIVQNRAEGYEVRDGEVVNDDPLSMRLPYAAGSLGSTVMDLLRWQRALDGGEVLSAKSREAMTRPGTLVNGKSISYGYGLAIGKMSDRRKISHGGGINGFRTQLSRYPDEDLTVVVLCNTGGANPATLESRLARAVLEIPERDIEEVELSRNELRIYAGTYHPGRGPIVVKLRDGRLLIGERTLRATGDHVFYPSNDNYQKITFTVEEGRATAMRIEHEGRVTEARRIEAGGSR